MAEIRTFEDLIVWQKAHGLFLEAARDTEQFPTGRAANVIANQAIFEERRSLLEEILKMLNKMISQKLNH